MRIRPVTILSLHVLVALSACASAGNFREENRQNLDRLHPGMTREEVLDIMGVGEQRQLVGSETEGPIGTGRDSLGVTSVQIPVGGDPPRLYNPHRSALFTGREGSSWEVLFYYTHVVRSDGQVTDDELTPIVLRDDLLTGWGWEHWAAQNARFDLGAELPDPLPERDSALP